jgi:hypothetical protein
MTIMYSSYELEPVHPGPTFPKSELLGSSLAVAGWGRSVVVVGLDACRRNNLRDDVGPVPLSVPAGFRKSAVLG